MMLARNFSISRKRPLQHLDVLHAGNIKPTPSRQSTSALPADLPRKQSDDSFLNTVIVRFNDSLLVLVSEANQPPILNRAVEQVMQFRVDCHCTPYHSLRSWGGQCVRPPHGQYFLGRGGISDASTGSNSNFGSSASGAKYAFVVFIQFLSSRSGKSGL